MDDDKRVNCPKCETPVNVFVSYDRDEDTPGKVKMECYHMLCGHRWVEWADLPEPPDLVA